MEIRRISIYLAIATVTSAAAYGPFYGNRDLLCNRGTRFACYCSTVTWRRFNRTDAPLCSQLFPGFEAATLELAGCDVRLEENPFANVASQGLDDDDSATTFERYFKRTLATLIRRECLQSPNDKRCWKIPSDLTEEHIVFTSYQCSNLRSSRLWMVVLGKPDDATAEQETTPQEETHFVEGSSIARVLNSATVLPQLNSHLFARRSRIMNVDHFRLEDTFKKHDIPKVKAEQDDSSQNRAYSKPPLPIQEEREEKAEDNESDSEKSTMEGRDVVSVTEGDDTYKFNWVAVLIGCLFVAYFLIVWVLAVIFCVR